MSSSSDNLQSWLATVKLGKFLAEADLIKLCEIVKGKLLEEPNIRPVSSPVTVCGDLHGQFYDVLELFKQGGDVERTKYIFLGDYVDRGYFSLETFTLLMLLKALYPDRVTLLRGNHESRTITQVYGFYDECQQKYASANAWKHCTQVFDFLTIAALIDDRIFCVHGGLSPDVTTLDHIRTISRNQEIPQDGAFCDLVWSDPEDGMAELYRVSPRGAGYVFGKSATTQFLHKNSLEKICRAHQLVQEGYTMCHDNKVITVWSAPNYCYRCGNRAAIMEYNRGEYFKQYDAVPNDQRVSLPQSATLNYFL